MKQRSFYKTASLVRWLGEVYTFLTTFAVVILLTDEPVFAGVAAVAVLSLSLAVESLEPAAWAGYWHWMIALVTLWLTLVAIELACALTLTDTVRTNLAKISGNSIDRSLAAVSAFLVALTIEVILRILLPRRHDVRRGPRRST